MCHILGYPVGVSGQFQYLRESIIYDLKQVDGQPIQVEGLDITGDVALTRALANSKDGQLIPQIPFLELTSVTFVIAKNLAEICIIR